MADRPPSSATGHSSSLRLYIAIGLALGLQIGTSFPYRPENRVKSTIFRPNRAISANLGRNRPLWSRRMRTITRAEGDFGNNLPSSNASLPQPSSGAGSGSESSGKGAKKGLWRGAVKWGLRLGAGYFAYEVCSIGWILYRGGGFREPPGDGSIETFQGIEANPDIFPMGNRTMEERDAYYFIQWRKRLDENFSKMEVIKLLEESGFNPDELKRKSKNFLLNLYLENILMEMSINEAKNITKNTLEYTPDVVKTKAENSKKTKSEITGGISNTTGGEIDVDFCAKFGMIPYEKRNISTEDAYLEVLTVLGEDAPSRAEFESIMNDKENDEESPAMLDSVDHGIEKAEEYFNEFYQKLKHNKSLGVKDSFPIPKQR